MPASGRLDRRIVIERATVTPDAFGQPIETWASWRTVWMGKKAVRAEERFRANQKLASQTVVWISPYIPGLSPKDRLVGEGRIYDIVGLAELGRRSGHEITATAIGAAEVYVETVEPIFPPPAITGTASATLAVMTASAAGTVTVPYEANAVTFDGADNLLRNAAMTGIADSASWTISFWFRRTTSATQRYIMADTEATWRVKVTFEGATNLLRVRGRNTAGADALLIETATAFTDNLWHHALFSSNGSTHHLYIDGVSDITVTTATGALIDFDRNTQWAIGCRSDAANDYIGDLSELMFWDGVYRDFSQAANRDLFYVSATRKPQDPAIATADLGAPLILLSGDTTTWHTNDGDGGGFTVSAGALTTGEIPVQWPVKTTQTFIATGLLEGDPVDAVNLAGSGGSGTLDLLFVQQAGQHFWYENNPLGTFTQRTIRGTAVTSAKFEGCAWGDFDNDGNHEAYSCDQVNDTIWVHVQDSPGTPTGTWTGAIIKTAVPNAQRVVAMTIDATKCLLCSYEGDAGSNGGVVLMTYNGGGLTNSANWTSTIITALPGAWWIDMAGLVTAGSNQRLYVSSRTAHNAGAAPGTYYITKPTAGGLHQTWTRTTVDNTVLDWNHVCTGDFFGNGVLTDAAIHDSGAEGTTTVTLKLFNSQDNWSATTIASLPLSTYRYNLRNITALTGQRNSRDVFLVCGDARMGALYWSGSAWTFEVWRVTTLKADSAILLVNLAGSAALDVVLADSHQNSIYWIDGATI